VVSTAAVPLLLDNCDADALEVLLPILSLQPCSLSLLLGFMGETPTVL
jgi:hypothetical protein